MTATDRPATVPSIAEQIADEVAARPDQIAAAVALLDGGATVPFIARYRKEVTGMLDDAQLRTIEERLRYLRELDERRTAIIESLMEQGKLTEQLTVALWAATTKSRLEDIYLPFKPKRRTRAMIAREAGLEPLADALLADPTLNPQTTAAAYLGADVADAAAALEGARAILIERFAEDADLIGTLREKVWATGELRVRVHDGMETSGAKYADYFDYAEALNRAPSHRILAVFRGEKENVLDVHIEPEPVAMGEATNATADATGDAGPGAAATDRYCAIIADQWGISDRGRPADRFLIDCVRRSWRGRIGVRVELDMRARLREQAERDAIAVFATNLRDLLLAAPAGPKATLGLDPGLRTGVKVAVVDATGKVVATDVIYPHAPHGRWREALATLGRLIDAHHVELIAIGNGTASRETDKLAAELVTDRPTVTKVVVSEAGASVYSASAYASSELPDLDVSLRGAVSIARRLQDPLAELVKIDPKSIGVGQYQHDLPEMELARSLDSVVEDCVNSVGVDLNTASVPLLTRVSGVGPALAEAIVGHRDTEGPFASRADLHKVPRLGPKAFEQCAGFLRITGGTEPLDRSAVHPEAYSVARAMAKTSGHEVAGLIGNSAALKSLRPNDFVTDRFGLPTINDVLAELDKPGRDPRPTFHTATFAEGVHEIADLVPGMILEGAVTNVAAFGAFVDVGVHQDGLVHVSAMAHRFVSDPREIVKSGDVVKVKVLDVDTQRKRISLSLRLDDDAARGNDGTNGKGVGGKADHLERNRGSNDGGPRRRGGQRGNGGGHTRNPNSQRSTEPTGAIADALRRAGYQG